MNCADRCCPLWHSLICGFTLAWIAQFAPITRAQAGDPNQRGVTNSVGVPVQLEGQLPVAANRSPASTAQRLTSNDEAHLILERALLSAVWGPPMQCLVQQEILMFDRRLAGSGRYFRGRSGLGEMKLNIKIVAGDHLNILHQVSDGRTLHTLQTIDGTTEGWRVDLGRVREYLGRFTQQDRLDPLVALHLSIGGQNEKLRAICQQYKWTSVESGKFLQPGKQTEEVDVWWLRGERNLEASRLRGQAEIDGLLAGADATGLAPQEIKIAIGRTAPLQYWLYHVEEIRRGRGKGNEGGYSLVARIDYHQPLIQEIAATTFSDPEVYATNVEPMVDETRKYLPPSRLPTSPTAAQP